VTIQADKPAVFQSGSVPVLSVMSVEVGGGEVLLEVSVHRTGAVAAIKPLRETATFTEKMIASVKTWRFTPAEAPIAEAQRKPGGRVTEPVESTVLVAGVFRRPGVTGVGLGDPRRDVSAPSDDIPFPTSIVIPLFPPMVVGPGVALVEVSVDETGGVTDAKIRVPAPGFDSAALDAARKWKFRAARPGGTGAPAVAYIVFGFIVPG
jgi:TonB family protein